MEIHLASLNSRSFLSHQSAGAKSGLRQPVGPLSGPRFRLFYSAGCLAGWLTLSLNLQPG